MALLCLFEAMRFQLLFESGDRLVKWRRRLRAQKQEAFPCAKTLSLSRPSGRKRDLVFLADHICCVAGNFEIPYSNLTSLPPPGSKICQTYFFPRICLVGCTKAMCFTAFLRRYKQKTLVGTMGFGVKCTR